MYKKIEFLNKNQIETVNIIRSEVQDRYWILNKIRLSEFLYSVKEYGTPEFYDDFKRINQITLPCVIFDTHENTLTAAIFFESEPAAEEVLKGAGVTYIMINQTKDALTHPELLRFYRE
ncbi:TPA: hypothetical protein L9968_005055 [Klebsiella aerogenes]|uniref:DUF2726 domain-containing protein n=3 Tax=Enterobacterales TaxID=91347 RepID=A0A1I3X9D7_9GAMM|nr:MULTISPECIES: DNA distortion polypeptide 3 [Enterobacterales]EAW3267803.1 hypothetical protein [Salmonella enterica]EBU6655485.1 hypothetical protein [Salmonella enterica subsp. enterica serovar Typhimurium]HBS0237537.1 hypothetical protein [Klebsiella aerogenes]APG53511.1 hypothetical protein BGK56_21465 [Providencia stuartii]EGN1944284.1 hypothetical protein [Salmonella enterica]